MESRIKNSARNVFFSEMAYAVTLILQFVNRSLFIRLLPEEFLGMNGLFSNILSLLSLTELGFGSALNFALYKPLKENDTESLKSLLRLYRRIYTATGLFVLVLGGALSHFLPYFIKEMPENAEHMYLYYFLYLVNSSVSYFFTYKRALILCSQKEYMISLISALSGVLLKISQIIVLCRFQSYTLYLSVMILTSALENIAISKTADRLFPYLKDRQVKAIDPQAVRAILKNGYALFFQKIGEVVVYATDNLILSKFCGFALVGLYSNYTMVISSLQAAAYRFFDSITASIGNLCASDEKAYVETTFYRILFIDAWMFCTCSVCLSCLLQPFIRLWAGPEYMLSDFDVFIIILAFYLEGIRASVVTFKRAVGFYWRIRYKPIIESALNLLLSIPFAIHFGIAGTLLGTIVSTFCMSFLYESWMLFHYYFQKELCTYMAMQAKYAAVTVFASFLAYGSCSLIRFPQPLLSLFAQLFVCVTVSGLCMAFAFRKNEAYVYFKGYVKRAIGRVYRR